ncbi:transglycosylase SLT domain-containing protein [Desulfococcus sp.]|uniref:lytic transglycosylase domain-containing protein n=1 Tax=Desulfococcus sp. TaxID=2025834 RepID=UPI0035939635
MNRTLHRTLLLWIASLFAAVSGFASGAPLEIPDAALFPSNLPAIRISPPLDFCGEPVPLDDPDIREELEKELILTIWNRPQFILYAKRTGRVMPYIERMLRENNMPLDLKYVAIAESALLPTIGSSAGAVGYWQFIKDTGRRYGLRIDEDIDERRNLFASTRAAIQYFRKLHGDFGSWTLAAASYNMGEAGMGRRIAEQGTRNYYHLYLPAETMRYVYRILAIKMILSDLPKYGFNLTREDLYGPVEFDRVQLTLSSDVPVRTIADASGTYFKKIKDLNPEILGNRLVRGSHVILVPKGASQGFSQRFSALVARQQAQRANMKKDVYVVKQGDSLTMIAERLTIPLRDLLQWNNLKYNSAIHPGQQLVIMR